MGKIASKYGILQECNVTEYYSNGKIKNCKLKVANQIKINNLKVIPYFGADQARRKDKSALSFYQNGNLKAISLAKQTLLKIKDNIYPAERILFYQSGEIKCIFPLDSKINGYWTEEDEYKLATKLKLKLSFVDLNNKIINLRFYKNGKIKSITLWPQERIDLTTPVGPLTGRIGFELFENGKLKSCEPAQPTVITTPLGKITVFDSQAAGINGDSNSLKFNSAGKLAGLKTEHNQFKIISKETLKSELIKPTQQPHIFNLDIKLTFPIEIQFENNQIIFNQKQNKIFSFANYLFKIKDYQPTVSLNCSSCQVS